MKHLTRNQTHSHSRNQRLISVLAAFTSLALAVTLLVPSVAAAQDDALSVENITAYYERMESMNAGMQEGHDDLETWLSYLDEAWTPDFKTESWSANGCSKMPDKPAIMTKEDFVKIYSKIGITNYETYEIELGDIKISDDGKQAKVNYTLKIFDELPNTKIYARGDAVATHIWDEENHRPIMQSQIYYERISLGSPLRDCQEQDEEQKSE